MTELPDLRLSVLRDDRPDPEGEYVLYWMIGQRRLGWNWALDRALHWCRELGRPLLILEALGLSHPYRSARFHRFVLDGMHDHARSLAESPVGYHPYLEPEEGAGSGLLKALSRSACVVVTDDRPYFIYPGLLEAARRVVKGRLEAVDGQGILPLRQTDRVFTTAYSFRSYLHKVLPDVVMQRPAERPITDDLPPFQGLPDDLLERWPPVSRALLEGGRDLSGFPLDHGVPPVAEKPGGSVEAERRLGRFLEDRFDRYLDRNDPDANTQSGLSPWLHWGMISPHRILHAVIEREGWTPNRISDDVRKGSREGWWGMSAPAEGFLDELITWRELSLNGARGLDDPTAFEGLPDWALETLAEHEDDPRPHLYSEEEFEEAATHDELWNAAQRELRAEGTIHNYLRMLWGKKILEWSESPREAHRILFRLNDRWALDGRDPNSVSGIMWTLGRYDRGWPERDVFGKVRSMTSDSTRRKVSVDDYLNRHGPQTDLNL